MKDLCDLHNEQAGKIVAEIVRPTIGNGGKASDVLVLLESVCAGVLATLELMQGGGAERGKVVEALAEGVRERWVEIIETRRKSAN